MAQTPCPGASFGKGCVSQAGLTIFLMWDQTSNEADEAQLR